MDLNFETLELVASSDFTIEDSCRRELSMQLVDLQNKTLDHILKAWSSTKPNYSQELSLGESNAVNVAPTEDDSSVRHCPSCCAVVSDEDAFCPECATRL